MAIPDYQTLMLPVLQVAAEGETRVPVAAQTIADRLGLTQQEREEMLPSGKQRLLHNRVHWAKFYLTKAGLIDSPKRGLFAASEAGIALLAKKPARIDLEVLKGYPAFADYFAQFSSKGQPDLAPATVIAEASAATPEEQIDAAHAVLAKALKTDLLARVLEQSPFFFERVIVELLVAMGYGGSHEDAARQRVAFPWPPSFPNRGVAKQRRVSSLNFEERTRRCAGLITRGAFVGRGQRNRSSVA